MARKSKSMKKKIDSHLKGMDLERVTRNKSSKYENKRKRTEAVSVPSRAASGIVSIRRSNRKSASATTVVDKAKTSLKTTTRALVKVKRVVATDTKTLLFNGLLAAHRLKTMNGRLVKVINTCAFDSLAAILARAYTDVPAYRSYVDASDNAMLRFCRDLAISGPRAGPTMSADRMHVLWPALDLRPLDRPKTPRQVTVLDAMCNVAHMVTRLLADAPSSVERVSPCSTARCGCRHSGRHVAIQPPRDLPSVSVVLQWPERGPEWLQTAVDQYADERLVECANCSRLSVTRRRELSAHLLIEADVCVELYGNAVHPFQLPVELFRDGNRYVLCGIVHYTQHHYTSVIRRPEKWEIHNDLLRYIRRPTRVGFINPHLVVYIRT